MNLSLRSFKIGNLSADNFKRYTTSMGRHLSPRYGRVILVSGYPDLIAVNFFWAPKLARKCESKHGFPVVRTDGPSLVWCTVTYQILPNFLGWVDFLSYRAPPTRRAWSSVKNYPRQKIWYNESGSC